MKYTLLFLLLFGSPTFILAQNKNSQTSEIEQNRIFEPISDTIPNISIFADDTPMELTLKYDITSFIRNKTKGEYLKAELKIDYKDFTNTKAIRLKARGNFRRKECFFPPIYLNFKTDPLENPELEGIRKIKLVTHCRSSASSTNYILKEYLAYKIYNVLSNNSFRVKLLNINYIDTGKRQRNYEQVGFLIEPLDLIAKRTNSTRINPDVVRAGNVIPEEADIVALFHYMIGNTDWRIKGGHNTRFIKSLDQISPLVTPVPYDFDFAGLVGTNYSHPQEWTSIKSVQEREYCGYCRPDEEYYMKAINYFIAKKVDIFGVVNGFDLLPAKEKESVRKYIESFYNEIENSRRILTILKNQCRDNNF